MNSLDELSAHSSGGQRTDEHAGRQMRDGATEELVDLGSVLGPAFASAN